MRQYPSDISREEYKLIREDLEGAKKTTRPRKGDDHRAALCAAGSIREALIKAGKGEVSSQKRRKCQGKERIEGRNPWNSYTSQLKGRKSPMRVGVNRPLWQAYTDLRWRRARVIG